MRDFLPVHKSWLRWFEFCPYVAQEIAYGYIEPVSGERALIGTLTHHSIHAVAKGYVLEGIPAEHKEEVAMLTENGLEMLRQRFAGPGKRYFEKFIAINEKPEAVAIKPEQEKDQRRKIIAAGTTDVLFIPDQTEADLGSTNAIGEFKTGFLIEDFLPERHLYTLLFYLDLQRQGLKPYPIHFHRLHVRQKKWRSWFYGKQELEDLTPWLRDYLTKIEQAPPLPLPGYWCGSGLEDHFCPLAGRTCPLGVGLLEVTADTPIGENLIQRTALGVFREFLKSGQITPANRAIVGFGAKFFDQVATFVKAKIKEDITMNGPLNVGRGAWRLTEYDTATYDTAQVLRLFTKYTVPNKDQLKVLTINKTGISKLGKEHDPLKLEIARTAVKTSKRTKLVFGAADEDAETEGQGEGSSARGDEPA